MAGPTVCRRRLLRYSGGTLTLVAAGCLGGNDESDDDNDGTDDGTDDGTSDTADGTDGNTSGTDTETGTHAHSSDHTVGQPVSDIEVEMISNEAGMHFGPHVVHVEPGGTVTWVLERGSHDTTAYHPETHGDQQRIPDAAEPWGSGPVSEEGDTFEQTFDVEGVYDYVCTPHERDGMVGTVLVGWPSPDDQPGLKPPAKDRPDAAIGQLERYNEQVRTTLAEGESGHNDSTGHDHSGNDHGDSSDDGHSH
ncbi:plastocyanin/azurin family copper-binding protein [Natrinema halophilum]|uniref:Blue (type 1) copper domain-containing protein n=1 Tax=Natrinema halophilum TaxID=1699371 RepID=A0A7D5KKQ4_9EURY|nr:plastocyanin/azurin family copper-binding protein [Natrinema halophilum]QLG50699.1 plastocyanin/azurin family copper-binding protein [Natrinema halophilum]